MSRISAKQTSIHHFCQVPRRKTCLYRCGFHLHYYRVFVSFWCNSLRFELPYKRVCSLWKDNIRRIKPRMLIAHVVRVFFLVFLCWLDFEPIYRIIVAELGVGWIDIKALDKLQLQYKEIRFFFSLMLFHILCVLVKFAKTICNPVLANKAHESCGFYLN